MIIAAALTNPSSMLVFSFAFTTCNIIMIPHQYFPGKRWRENLQAMNHQCVVYLEGFLNVTYHPTWLSSSKGRCTKHGDQE
jgi:hypothetical protein